MRFRDHGLPDTATAAEIRDARGDHDIIFEQGDGAGLLKASLPGLQWRAVGGEEVLSLWEFSSIMLEPGMTLRGDGTKHFGGHVPGLAPLMSAWAEPGMSSRSLERHALTRHAVKGPGEQFG